VVFECIPASFHRAYVCVDRHGGHFEHLLYHIQQVNPSSVKHYTFVAYWNFISLNLLLSSVTLQKHFCTYVHWTIMAHVDILNLPYHMAYNLKTCCISDCRSISKHFQMCCRFTKTVQCSFIPFLRRRLRKYAVDQCN
jgi:hypothetical protein